MLSKKIGKYFLPLITAFSILVFSPLAKAQFINEKFKKLEYLWESNTMDLKNWHNLIVPYIRPNKLDDGMRLATRHLDLAVKHNNKLMIGAAHSSLSLIHRFKNNTNKAIEHIDIALPYFEKYGELINYVGELENSSFLYAKIGDHKKLCHAVFTGNKLMRESGIKGGIFDASQRRVEILKSRNVCSEFQ